MSKKSRITDATPKSPEATLPQAPEDDATNNAPATLPQTQKGPTKKELLAAIVQKLEENGTPMSEEDQKKSERLNHAELTAIHKEVVGE